VSPGIKTLATGTEGRHLLNINGAIEPLCIEEALKNLQYRVDALVSMGGEDLVVYTIDKANKIITSFSGNKCASGTGEFFRQQLARMNMRLSDIASIPEDSRVLKLSSRCSVFMKSDCTHRLNKGEARTGDIVLSLSDVMAIKVSDFLKKARIKSGKVLLVGGMTLNPYLVRFIRDLMPEVAFIIPEEAPYFEAYGAALLATATGSPLPSPDSLFKKNRVHFKRFKSLRTAQGRVTYLPSRKGRVVAGREYILGVDGGSTTTKACLIDMESSEVTASFYGRTHGDPVAALKNCLVEIKKQIRDDIGDGEINITLAATTGSSREILGVFLETPAVYNEIIAHAVGTTYYRDDIDTIFEIGGQDAKYRLPEKQRPHRLRHERSLFRGNRLFSGRIGAGGSEHPGRFPDRRHTPSRRRSPSSSENTAPPSSIPTYAMPSSREHPAKTSPRGSSPPSSPTISTASWATGPSARTSSSRAASPRTRPFRWPSPCCSIKTFWFPLIRN